MLLIYTFSVLNNKTFKFLRQFKYHDLEKGYIHRIPSTRKLLKTIEENFHTPAIGLGDFRKDAKRIRIESKFINRYGKFPISIKGRSFYIPTLDFALDGIEGVYKADSVTNGPCNRAAYLVAEYIETKKLHTKYAYIHIPRSKTISEITDSLNTLLTNVTKRSSPSYDVNRVFGGK